MLHTILIVYDIHLQISSKPGSGFQFIAFKMHTAFACVTLGISLYFIIHNMLDLKNTIYLELFLLCFYFITNSNTVILFHLIFPKEGHMWQNRFYVLDSRPDIKILFSLVRTLHPFGSTEFLNGRKMIWSPQRSQSSCYHLSTLV